MHDETKHTKQKSSGTTGNKWAGNSEQCGQNEDQGLRCTYPFGAHCPQLWDDRMTQTQEGNPEDRTG